tara:strand:+ start:75 stop:296 length:222 start_codon:yes stop_codon:yes gene_type:complete
MFEFKKIEEPNFSMYRFTLLYIFSIGTAIQLIDHDEIYKSQRYCLFIRLLGINIGFEIMGGSDHDIHITLRLF